MKKIFFRTLITSQIWKRTPPTEKECLKLPQFFVSFDNSYELLNETKIYASLMFPHLKNKTTLANISVNKINPWRPSVFSYIYISSSCRTVSTNISALSRHTSLLSIASDWSSRLDLVSAQSVCRFQLDVLSLNVHVKGSTGVQHLWTRPYLSSSVQYVWFV